MQLFGCRLLTTAGRIALPPLKKRREKRHQFLTCPVTSTDSLCRFCQTVTGICVMTGHSYHGWLFWRQDILLVPCGDCLPYTNRLRTHSLGRCSGSNQVRSVPSSWRVDNSPVTRGNKGKKGDAPASRLAAMQPMVPAKQTRSIKIVEGGY